MNLHVFTEGCAEVDQLLLFRDWLAKRERRFMQNYAGAKTEIVHEILVRVRAARG